VNNGFQLMDYSNALYFIGWTGAVRSELRADHHHRTPWRSRR